MPNRAETESETKPRVYKAVSLRLGARHRGALWTLR